MKTMIAKIKIVALALVTIFTTSATFAASANGKNPQEVRYVGNVNDLPVYRLSLNNKKDATFVVSIKDTDGNMLYSEKISGKEIVRNYQIEDIPDSEYSLTFEVSNLNEKTNSVYEVNKTKKIFDEVEVSKVK